MQTSTTQSFDGLRCYDPWAQAGQAHTADKTVTVSVARAAASVVTLDAKTLQDTDLDKVCMSLGKLLSSGDKSVSAPQGGVSGPPTSSSSFATAGSQSKPSQGRAAIDLSKTSDAGTTAFARTFSTGDSTQEERVITEVEMTAAASRVVETAAAERTKPMSDMDRAAQEFKEAVNNEDLDKDRPLLLLTKDERKKFMKFKDNAPQKVKDWLLSMDERGVNAAHQNSYGKYAQSLYCKHCKLLSLYTVFALVNNFPSNVELIKKIGSGRGFFAKLTSTKGASDYGQPRSDTHRIRLDYSIYHFYKKQAEIISTRVLHSDIKYYDYEKDKWVQEAHVYEVESRCDFLGTAYHPTLLRGCVIDCDTTMNDKVWNKLNELLEDAKKPSVSFDEIGEKIGRFHWYFAQFIPFDRGSAAVAEIMTDALWLYHGYIRSKLKMLDKDNRVSPDLESLVPKDGPLLKKIPDPKGGPGATKDDYPEDRYCRNYVKFWTEYTPIADKDWASKAFFSIPRSSALKRIHNILDTLYPFSRIKTGR